MRLHNDCWCGERSDFGIHESGRTATGTEVAERDGRGKEDGAIHTPSFTRAP